MKRTEFKKKFDNYDPTEILKQIEFDETSWNTQINEWNVYYEDIISENGLSFEKWIKNEDGYLPDFLEKKEKKFGHARGGGSMESSMIYYNTGEKEDKKNKYYNGYSKKYSDNREDVENDYNTHIKPLIKNIAKSKTLEELYNVENTDDYKYFSGKQLLRKISILISCNTEINSELKNAFLWIFDEGKIKKIAEILEVKYEDDKTFLFNNNNIYKKALEYAGMNNNSRKFEFIKLNYFLVFLIDETTTVKEISNLFDNGIKQVILTGAPGTGKTYSAKKIASSDEYAEIIKKDGDVEIKYEFVQFHPSYDYTDFVEGLRPVQLEGNENPTFVRMDGIFKDFCRKAAFSYKKSDENNVDYKRFYIIIDEINRADLSKVFGELMYCLEYRGLEGKVRTQYSNLKTYMITKNGPKTFDDITQSEAEYQEIINVYGKEDLFKDGFYIPKNVYIIGTMNDIDRSVESFDFALRRRFKWFEIKVKDVINEILPNILSNNNAYVFLKDKINKLNNFISKSNENEMGLTDAYCIGPAYFKNYDEVEGSTYKAKLANIYKFEIEPTLKEYVRGRNQDDINEFLRKCKEEFGLSEDYKFKEPKNNSKTAESVTQSQNVGEND